MAPCPTGAFWFFCPNEVNTKCPSGSIWLSSRCVEYRLSVLSVAMAMVIFFHLTAGLFKTVKPEHRAGYGLGSHAIFHIEQSGTLRTRRHQACWMLAATAVIALQYALCKFAWDQMDIWFAEVSEASPGKNAMDTMTWSLSHTYGHSNNRYALL